MKLPKIDYPRLTTELPWSKRTITYRPYSTKEEKLLMMAAAVDELDDEEVTKNVIQVIENCCSVDVTTLHPVDVEWLFIKLKSASDSPILEVSFFPPTCTTEDCPDEIQAYMNLEEARVENLDKLEETGFTRKGDFWVIELANGVGMRFKDLKESREDRTVDQIIVDSIDCIFDEQDVYPAADIDRAELIAYVEDLIPAHSAKLKSFFELQPKLVCPIAAICPKCKKVHESKIEGLTSFFE